jgi:hypothetical protein
MVLLVNSTVNYLMFVTITRWVFFALQTEFLNTFMTSFGFNELLKLYYIRHFLRYINKGKVVLLKIKHRTTKRYTGGGFSSIFSWLKHYIEANGQLHSPSTVNPVPIGCKTGWAPGVGLDMLAERKVFWPSPGTNSGSPVCSPPTHYTDWTACFIRLPNYCHKITKQFRYFSAGYFKRKPGEEGHFS